MCWKRTDAGRVSAVAMGAVVAATQQATAGTILPIDQDRSILAHVTTDCEGTTQNQDTPQGFDPFDSSVGAFQICDAEGIFANSAASQESAIGASTITAAGSAFSAGESPSGLHAFAFSFFEVTFDLGAASSYTADGVIGVSFGLPGGHAAMVSLAGPGGQTIFVHSLVGTGDPPESEQIEVTIGSRTKKLRTIGNKWSHIQATRYLTNTQPYYRMLGSQGEDLGNGSADYEHHGNVEDFRAWLEEGLALYKASN